MHFLSETLVLEEAGKSVMVHALPRVYARPMIGAYYVRAYEVRVSRELKSLEIR